MLDADMPGLTSTASAPSRQNRKRYRPFMASSWMLCIYLAVLTAGFVLVEMTIMGSEDTDAGVNDTASDKHFQVTPSTESVFATLPGPSYTTAQLTITSQSTSAIETGAPPPNSLLIITTRSSEPLPSSHSAVASSNSLQTVSTSPAPTNGAPPPQSELTLSGPLTKVDYILGLYLPKLTAVVLQSLWSIMFASMKMMEPFYQLGYAEGSTARASLLSDYLTTGLITTFLSSFSNGQGILVFASIVYVNMTLIITLVSEAFAIKSLSVCQNNQPCDPAWVVDIPTARVIQGLLALSSFLISITALGKLGRNSPIDRDPSSIAAVASLLGHPPLMHDLRSQHAQASTSNIKTTFGSHRYRLSQYFDTGGNRKYGIVKIDPQVTIVEEHVGQKGYQPVPNPLDLTSEQFNSMPNSTSSASCKDVVFDTLLLAGTGGLFSLILTYYLIGQSTSSFNDFMNSNSFGPRFMLSGLATLISIGFKRVEKSTRLLEVYRHMSKSPQQARNSILASQAGTPFTSVFISISRGQIFASWLAFITILSEFMIVAVSGVPYGTAQTSGLYIGSTYVSVIILALMMSTILVVMIRRRQDPAIPRSPDSLINVALYLAGSNLVEVLAHRNGRERSLDMELSDKHFKFGWASGIDGKSRWTVSALQSRHDS